MTVKLTVVGSSPAWPNPGGAQSGYLVEGPGKLLLDCGSGVLAKLRDMNGAWPRVDSIVITHWHLDHWGDLVPWVWGNMVGPGKGREKPELWVPPEGRERVRDFGSRLGWDDMFEQTFELRDYPEATAVEIGGAFLGALLLAVEHVTGVGQTLQSSGGAGLRLGQDPE